MKRSQLFIKTSKTSPAGEVALNAQLLIRAGYVYKVMAGVYAYTTLGLKVLENIKQIVREEMNAIAGQELIMSSLQKKETWEGTGRWDDETVDVWFKSKLKDDTEVGFGWSHEEAIMEMMQQFIQSYKDLPTSVYQFQTKLRNELRAKSGIMRGREFVMKDMYSLHATQADLDQYYEQVKQAYLRIYQRLGLGEDTYVTFASGGAFTQFSHEFQTVCEAGEDVLYIHRGKNIAVNEEVLDAAVAELGLDKNELDKVKAAEVGNIFNFGPDKAQQMKITYTNAEGQQEPVYLASYGIGITRVMGVIVEKMADDRGLVWPESVAPATVYLVQIGQQSKARAEELYQELTGLGVEVIYDDRDERPGSKFADAELMGMPLVVTVSDRLMESDNYELKYRQGSQAAQILTKDSLIAIINKSVSRD